MQHSLGGEALDLPPSRLCRRLIQMRRLPVIGRTAISIVLAALAIGSLAAAKAKKIGEFDAAKLPPAVTKEVDFVRDVRPLLEARCWRCHGDAKHESGLSLHRKEAAFAGGDNG